MRKHTHNLDILSISLPSPPLPSPPLSLTLTFSYVPFPAFASFLFCPSLSYMLCMADIDAI